MSICLSIGTNIIKITDFNETRFYEDILYGE